MVAPPHRARGKPRVRRLPVLQQLSDGPVSLVPAVPIIYDMVAFEPSLRPAWRSMVIERLTLGIALRRAAAFIAISRATADAFEQRFPQARGRTTVAPLAAAPSVSSRSDDKRATPGAGLRAGGGNARACARTCPGSPRPTERCPSSSASNIRWWSSGSSDGRWARRSTSLRSLGTAARCSGTCRTPTSRSSTAAARCSAIRR